MRVVMLYVTAWCRSDLYEGVSGFTTCPLQLERTMEVSAPAAENKNERKLLRTLKMEMCKLGMHQSTDPTIYLLILNTNPIRLLYFSQIKKICISLCLEL